MKVGAHDDPHYIHCLANSGPGPRRAHRVMLERAAECARSHSARQTRNSLPKAIARHTTLLESEMLDILRSLACCCS